MSNIDLSTKIGEIHLDSCIYNASGPKCTTENELNDLFSSPAGAVLTKSSTIEKRTGNPEPRYVGVPFGSINSMGLPNLGVDFYKNYIENIENPSKPVFLSVAGLTLEENISILKKVKGAKNLCAVELNLSCPNVPGKPQTGYDFERTEEVLDKVFEFYDEPIGVKLPPYFDIVHFEQMANILNKFPLAFVTSINSIGNGLYIDVEKEETVIKPKRGFGGIGGKYVKPTTLANVRMFYLLLENIPIIGCGGIETGEDAFEHILCGASAVQIGTKLMEEGTSCFSEIEKGLKEVMNKKGYKKLDDFRGKLKEL